MKRRLFDFIKTDGGYILTSFSQKSYYDGDGIITELVIPARHNFRPVVEIGESAFTCAWNLEEITISEGIRKIGESAFQNCKKLRSVSLPASLEAVDKRAFNYCEKLCEVEFKTDPSFGEFVFWHCNALPPELILAGAVCSLDITRPLNSKMLRSELFIANDLPNRTPWFCRPDVFALAAENDGFRELGADLLDELIDYCVRNNHPEQTAYFRDLKRRKFGFTRDDLDL